MAGPALGGGHGVQQGKYGLISDNILSMNVVLANGSTLRVSETDNSDLWWAMRGAGHNFGVVTSFEMRIYPKETETYFYRSYLFKGDALESLFESLNNFHNNGTLTSRMVGAFGVYGINPEVSDIEVR